MAYTPTEWQSGDIVTSEKLNKIENGIAETSGLCVLTDGTLDKSYNDLLGMVNSGIIPFIFHSNGYLYFLSSCDTNEDGISFKENAYNSTVLLFYAPDGDPDANLLLD